MAAGHPGQPQCRHGGVAVLKQEAKCYGLDDGEPDGLTPEDGRDGVCLPLQITGYVAVI